ncbi:hypothetical protein CABS01_00202 [Colletotrichum abscissum]|uniref:uncharacterized protein n=1 Tax=Colletotrichum abscissum TaxID=1671311 RepID=UPI0027D6A2DA|nr:uncharacterized protein CABS01_00202 [Colletotrichum abscissum]KAK1525113.1 hypothetical protein CABS01_00202 [Colletotrichum abscissum]
MVQCHCNALKKKGLHKLILSSLRPFAHLQMAPLIPLSLSSLMQCALLLLFLRHRCADQRPSPQSLTLTGTIAIIITTKLGLGPRLLIPDFFRLV